MRAVPHDLFSVRALDLVTSTYKTNYYTSLQASSSKLIPTMKLNAFFKDLQTSTLDLNIESFKKDNHHFPVSSKTNQLFQPLIIAVFVEVLPFGDFVEGWINFRTLTYLLDWIGVKIGCIDGIATFPVPDILMKVEPKPPMTNTSNIGNFGRDRRAIVTIPMLGATFL